MNDLHSYIKNLESKVQEKEAFIRALKSQKSEFSKLFAL